MCNGMIIAKNIVKMNKKAFLFFCHLIIQITLCAQYTPSASFPNKIEEWINQYELDTKLLINNINSEFKKEITKVYNERKNWIIDQLKDEQFIFDSQIQEYLEGILDTIATKNEYRGSNLKILVNKSAVPNASCFGDGILVINLGLFRYLDTKDQLAFVIAHELAHQVLKPC